VLEVGCGTGTFSTALAERTGSRVWAVDAEPRMLEVARTRVQRGVGLKLGDAEDLPFRDGWFERVVMRLLIHLVDRPRAFAEARRVLSADGILAIATFDHSHFEPWWLNRFFPSIEAIDRARFPSADELNDELRASGFDVRLVRLDQAAEIKREEALARIRGRHISTFDLIDEPEYELGSARAERELPPEVGYVLHWLVAVATPAT
jgi:SAM-dependent methyltransferase